MNASIRHIDPESEYFFREGCHINELVNLPHDDALSVAQARVEPGVTTKWHRLKDTVERYVITSGVGQVEIGDLPPETVRAGDMVMIPAMCRQRITNTGDDDLIFLAICTPPFRHEIYEELEDNA